MRMGKTTNHLAGSEMALPFFAAFYCNLQHARTECGEESLVKAIMGDDFDSACTGQIVIGVRCDRSSLALALSQLPARMDMMSPSWTM